MFLAKICVYNSRMYRLLRDSVTMLQNATERISCLALLLHIKGSREFVILILERWPSYVLRWRMTLLKDKFMQKEISCLKAKFAW